MKTIIRSLFPIIALASITACELAQVNSLQSQDPAITLTSGGWSEASYEVLFTNPVCPRQKFVSYRPRHPQPQTLKTAFGDVLVSPERSQVPELVLDSPGIPTLGGGFREAISGNIFCESNDLTTSTVRGSSNPYRRTDSPLHRIQDWLESTRSGDELFVASFSLSMKSVATWTCEAAQRGVKVKVFMNEPDFGSGAFDIISQCPGVELLQFKSKGRLAHMKSIMIVLNNPEHDDTLRNKVRVSFQSGNISTGTWGHHENWNFVTQDRNHWFSQDHICLRDAITEETVSNLGKLYKELDACRKAKGIDEVRAQDSLMKNFFIPKSGGVYDDRKELDQLVQEVAKSAEVWIAAHHLTEPDLVSALAQRLRSHPDFKVHMLLDAELFWANYDDGLARNTVRKVEGKVYGDSSSLTSSCMWGVSEEASKTTRCSLFSFGEFGDSWDAILQAKRSDKMKYGPRTLESVGAELRFIESNHLGKMLFHNKFMIFRYAEPESGLEGAVFTGAGNLSRAGFDKNFENYYLTRIPHVYAAFRQQFVMLFDKATVPRDLPITWDFRTVDDGYETYP